MIPSRVHSGTPPSEKRVFDRLREDPRTEEWTVLHSLGLARRGKKPYGEIDFVVLIPKAGVICLEVKGGGVSCREGIWYTRDRHGLEHRLNRSPIAQAREGMFGLRRAVEREFGPGSGVASMVYGAAVVLPDVTRFPRDPEHDPPEVIDIEALQRPISGPIMAAVKNDARRMQKTQQLTLATPTNIKRLRNYLRPDFDITLARSTTIRRSEERIVRLTEEQYDVLDLFERNARCVVEGAAGTGKTLLALEYARRAAPRYETILLLCYNRLLGEWLARRATEILPTNVVIAGSFHRYLRDLIVKGENAEEFRRAESAAKDDSEQLFNQVYPLYGELALLESRVTADLCIVDEAQDLMADPVLSVLEVAMKGGLGEGQWAMLGDFTRQALFSGLELGWKEVLSQYIEPERYTTAPLSRNCRNTYKIGEETALLSGFDSLPYRLDNSECLPVDYRYWRNRQHQAQRLRSILDTLAKDGVSKSDVVILSRRRLANSVVSMLGRDIRSAGTRQGQEAEIVFSTIHAFKGLESPVVILCDVDRLDSDVDRALMYVGMSRARSHLIVLLHERLQSIALQAMDRKLKGWF